MPTTESSAPAHTVPETTTRFERGITLASQRFEEITRVAPWCWSVPSCSGPGVYRVDLKRGSCNCADRTPAGEECKHLAAARFLKAKTATCAGCGERVRHRDLVEVGDENLTFFEGDLVCIECAGDHGVI